MSKKFLEIKNVDFNIGGKAKVKNASFEIENEGETICILGPSGIGKTTILRILMTLETIDDGFVSVNNEYLWHEKNAGKIVNASDKHLQKMRDHIGMVFQQFNLFPHLTAIENVQEPQILIKKKNKSEAHDKASELFNMIGYFIN